jgi:hypothetical protein
MENFTLVIAVLALILALVAYYRSSGTRRLRALEKALNGKIELLTAVAKRATDSLAAGVRAGYRRSIRIIANLQSRVTALKEGAADEIGDDLRRLAETLNGLAERAARAAKDLKEGIELTVIEAEVGLRLALDEAKARLKVIEAKREILLARAAVLHNDFDEAERRVLAALSYIEEALALTANHYTSAAALYQQALEMLAAIRAKAATVKESLDALIERGDRLLDEMNSGRSQEKAAA